MEAELDQVDGRPIIGPERRLECLIARLGLARSWRLPNLAKYATDEALRAAAGRTNLFVNLYGAGISVSGAANGSGCGCHK